MDLISCENLNDIEIGNNMQRLREGKRMETKSRPCLQRFVIPDLKMDMNLIPDDGSNFFAKHALFSGTKATRVKDRLFLYPQNLSNPMDQLDTSNINDKFSGKKYKFVYCSPTYAHWGSQYFGKVVKLNVDTGEKLVWGCDEDEPFSSSCNICFVPNPNGVKEDDGIIINSMSPMRRSTGGDNFLVFIDAQSMKEIARVYFRARIVPWFHCLWFDKENNNA